MKKNILSLILLSLVLAGSANAQKRAFAIEDLYRLKSLKEAESIGLDDHLSGPTVVAVEWADKAPGILPEDRLEMELRHRTVQSRSIQLRATGPLSAALLNRIKSCAALPTSHFPSGTRRSVKGKSPS